MRGAAAVQGQDAAAKAPAGQESNMAVAVWHSPARLGPQTHHKMDAHTPALTGLMYVTNGDTTLIMPAAVTYRNY